MLLCFVHRQYTHHQERIRIWAKVHKWHLKLHDKIKTHSAHDIWRPNSSHHSNSSIYHSSILPNKHSSGCTYSSDYTLQWYKAHDVYLHPAETKQMISQPAGGKVPPQWKQCSAWWNDDSKFVLTLQLVSGAYKIARPQMRDNSVAVSHICSNYLDMKLYEWCLIISGSHNTIVNHTGLSF